MSARSHGTGRIGGRELLSRPPFGRFCGGGRPSPPFRGVFHIQYRRRLPWRETFSSDTVEYGVRLPIGFKSLRGGVFHLQYRRRLPGRETFSSGTVEYSVRRLPILVVLGFLFRAKGTGNISDPRLLVPVEAFGLFRDSLRADRVSQVA